MALGSLAKNAVPIVLQPIDTITALNLDTVATGRIARYVIPPTQFFVNTNTFQHGWEILGHFWAEDGAAANTTTQAVICLKVNGTESTVLSNLGANTTWSRVTINPTGNTTDGQVLAASVESVVFPLPPPVLGSTSTVNPGAGQPNTYFPTCQSGDTLETWLLTQSVGGGNVTGRPFVVVRPKLIDGLTS